MIISMKPVGLLNTDNVKKIDGLGRVMLRGGDTALEESGGSCIGNGGVGWGGGNE